MSDVVRRGDLLAAGMTEAAMQAQLDARRWRTVTSTVVVRHNGPLSRAQERDAVVLTAGRGAQVGAWTALELHGMRGWERRETWVLVPRGARPPSFASLPVVVRSTRTLPVPVRRYGVPASPPGRAAVDAASWSATDRAAYGLVASVIRQRLVRAADLRAELDRLTRTPRRALLRGLVADVTGGAEALSELDFLAFCRRHRFPRPVGQHRVGTPSGSLRIDATFAGRGATERYVEINGSVHLLPTTYADDLFRGNGLVIAGRSVLQLPSWAVRDDDLRAVDQLRRFLAA